MSSPGAVRAHLRLRFADLEHEEFHALWLDAQNCLIAADLLLAGTLTQTSVYPREVVKTALAHNAGAVILAHNHPSGTVEPSIADKWLTEALKAALSSLTSSCSTTSSSPATTHCHLPSAACFKLQ